MTVSAIASAAFVPLGAPPRPPGGEAGDGRTDDVTGSRVTETDGARRVVLSRSAGAATHRGHGQEVDGSAGAEPHRRYGQEVDGSGGDGPAAGVEQLSEDEQRVVREMRARDAEVRAHEMAHVAAGGAHVTSGPSYSYQQGPDGRRYAVGGEVGIDTSPEEDPQATIVKMAQVRAAAMAPAEPSGADRAVAAAATANAAEARAELLEERTEAAEDSEAEDGRSERPGPAASPDAPAHHHGAGGVCAECVGPRYAAAGSVAPPPTVDAAA